MDLCFPNGSISVLLTILSIGSLHNLPHIHLKYHVAIYWVPIPMTIRVRYRQACEEHIAQNFESCIQRSGFVHLTAKQ